MKLESYQWQCLKTADEVAQAACQQILAAAEAAITERGQFKIVLAGGTTPEKVYRLLVKSKTDWSKWWIYHGDERCLPVDHQDRNSLMVAEAWLNHVSIPKAQIFNIPAELGPEEGAVRYHEIIQSALPFDLVLLGMGEDGHTASLFPGHNHDLEQLTYAVYNSPKPPPERVSLSAKALSNTLQVIFLITGANKHEALQQWRAGESLPITTIHANNMIVMTDRAALGKE